MIFRNQYQSMVYINNVSFYSVLNYLIQRLIKSPKMAVMTRHELIYDASLQQRYKTL